MPRPRWPDSTNPVSDEPGTLQKAAGFVEVRSGKGSHLLLKHPTSGKEVWVAVHTKKDAGRLGNRILREAGVE
jgi:predicted RNA binding protein YcfA (HicA-like mRNA interferase family)